jgi:hypothetical protein
MNADKTTAVTIQRWGGPASFLLAVAFILPSLIYLTGNLDDAYGPLAYDVADFLYGPVWAASLVMVICALRERIGEHAPRRMNLALAAAFVAAAAMVAVACVRAANRHYHLMHPELNLETSTTVLVVWTTLVAGLSATAWHFLGWTLALVGWAGWTSRRLPRPLSGLYLVIGAAALFVYLRPDSEFALVLPAAVMSIWQGILLWKTGTGEAPAGRNKPEPGVLDG